MGDLGFYLAFSDSNSQDTANGEVPKLTALRDEDRISSVGLSILPGLPLVPTIDTSRLNDPFARQDIAPIIFNGLKYNLDQLRERSRRIPPHLPTREIIGHTHDGREITRLKSNPKRLRIHAHASLIQDDDPRKPLGYRELRPHQDRFSREDYHSVLINRTRKIS